MTCAISDCETLFDLSPVSRVQERRFERERLSTIAELFEIFSEVRRRRGGEIMPGPEEDLERWDGQS